MTNRIALFLFIFVTHANLVLSATLNRTASLKPLSVCCDIPEIGQDVHLATCGYPKKKGPCDDIQCVFQESRFLIDKDTLNKDTYRMHLTAWGQEHKGWPDAVEKAIKDCVDTETRQYLTYPCKAYDVFACTGIALLKKCPGIAWRC